jgi:hypothetical protein
LCIALHKSVIVQFKLKGVQVLIGRAVNTAAVSDAELTHRIFIERDGGAGEQVSVIAVNRRIIVIVLAGTAVILQPGALAVGYGILHSQANLYHKAFESPVVVHIQGVDIFGVFEAVALILIVHFVAADNIKTAEIVVGAYITYLAAYAQPSFIKIAFVIHFQ